MDYWHEWELAKEEAEKAEKLIVVGQLIVYWRKGMSLTDNNKGFFTITHILSERVILASTNWITKEAAVELARRFNTLDFDAFWHSHKRAITQDDPIYHDARTIYITWLKEQYVLFDFN